jgi:succinate dehydrogenase/fumarate reductase flavoprotein subunit
LEEGRQALCQIDKRLADASAETTAEVINLIEARRMALCAHMILNAGLSRTESRGAHQRTDFANQDDTNWLRHISFRRGHDGSLVEGLTAIQ